MDRRRKDAVLAIAWDQRIKGFFRQEPISRVSPNMKDVLLDKNDGSRIPKRFLQMSLKRAFSLFQQDNPDYPFRFTVFRRSKPREVVKMKEHHHANVGFQLAALQNIFTTMKTPRQEMLSSMEALSDSTLCSGDSIQCINRKCDNCGVSKLHEHFSEFLRNTSIRYQKWVYVEPEKQTGSKRCRLVTLRVDGDDFLCELKASLELFPQHLFTSKNQHDAMNTVIKNLPMKHAVVVLDFSENYACLVDDEVQSAHWTIQQVTLHPMTVYVHHKDSTPANPHVLKVAIVGVSDDLVHDVAAVTEFLKDGLKKLKEMPEAQDIEMLHQFTDGCASQYKGRESFSDLTHCEHDLGLYTVRNYFESGHGKGPCDGLGATVKSSARQAVLQHRAVIRDAQELFAFCQKDLMEVAVDEYGKRKKNAADSYRFFFYVSKARLEAARATRTRASATLSGTRRIHFVAPTGHYQLLHRSLSCYCKYCIDGDYSCCLRSDVVGVVNAVKMMNGKWKVNRILFNETLFMQCPLIASHDCSRSGTIFPPEIFVVCS